MYVWQMSYLLVSMRLGLPEGVDYYKVAKYSPTGATGTEERHSLWLSIVAAMFECGGLGRHRTLAGYITAYEYSMTDPTRALAFGRMWTKHGVEISETKSANLAKSPSKSVSGKVMATGETMSCARKLSWLRCTRCWPKVMTYAWPRQRKYYINCCVPLQTSPPQMC